MPVVTIKRPGKKVLRVAGDLKMWGTRKGDGFVWGFAPVQTIDTGQVASAEISMQPGELGTLLKGLEISAMPGGRPVFVYGKDLLPGDEIEFDPDRGTGEKERIVCGRVSSVKQAPHAFKPVVVKLVGRAEPLLMPEYFHVRMLKAHGV